MGVVLLHILEDMEKFKQDEPEFTCISKSLGVMKIMKWCMLYYDIFIKGVVKIGPLYGGSESVTW